MVKKSSRTTRQTDESAGGGAAEAAPTTPPEPVSAAPASGDVPRGARLCLSEFEHPYRREVHESEDAFYWLLTQKRQIIDSGSVKKDDDLNAARVACAEQLAAAVEKAAG